MYKKICLFIFITAFSSILQAKAQKILFIGNSFTFEPGDERKPALPQYVAFIMQKLKKELKVEFVIKGGQTLKKHVDDGEVFTKLNSQKFDYVVIQPHSIEALELPRCFYENGGPFGRPEFLYYAEVLVDMIQKKGAKAVLLSPWTYQKEHPWLKSDFLCLRFKKGENKAGEKWFGDSLSDYLSFFK